MTATPPILDPDDLGESLPPNVGGVVLAAGTGSRFADGNKLLAAVEGEPVVRRAVRTLLEGSLTDVAVVVGHEATAVREALAGLDVTVLENPDYEAGQSSSLRRGVDHAREAGWDAVVFGLGDMPAVAPRSVDLLLRAYAGGAESVVAAAHDGLRGNPVLFDARHFDALASVEGDTGGRPVLLAADDLALVETGDPGVTRDVDTVSDLEEL